MAAHPRSRGENDLIRVAGYLSAGSSPLTRGKPRVARIAGLPGGLIPAHAGKTFASTSSACPARAHPRSRGENDSLPGCTSGWEGSSPLTRGKRQRRKGPRNPHRLIPAHAGKTTVGALAVLPDRAHPRSRGENAYGSPLSRLSQGSSPLTRGKLLGQVAGARHHGLIPAHAGKTGKNNIFANVQGAHPRSRGENRRSPGNLASKKGSSPLTRGKQGSIEKATSRGRLIPAHAGKTTDALQSVSRPWAHPRSRGENSVPCNSSSNS